MYLPPPVDLHAFNMFRDFDFSLIIMFVELPEVHLVVSLEFLKSVLLLWQYGCCIESYIPLRV